MESLTNATKLLRSGRFEAANEVLSSLLLRDPSNLLVQELLSYALAGLGQKQRAINLLSRVANSEGASIGALYEYSSLLLNDGSPANAIEPLERAIKMAPDIFEVRHDLATAYALAGRRKEAIEQYKIAAKISKDSSELFYNIGHLYDQEFNFEIANSFYLKALAIDPSFREAQVNLGLNLCRISRHREGIPMLEGVLKERGHIDFLYGDMVHAKMQLCSWSNLDHEISTLLNGIESGEKIVSPFIALSLIDDPKFHQKVAKIYADVKFKSKQKQCPPKKQSRSKIKVGYFSHDFRDHAVTNLIAELFELHNKNEFEIYAFSSSSDNKSEQKLRLKKAFHEFIETAQLSDDQVASLSRQKEIDIAVDLGGYTENARIGIFQRRAAPLQVSYLGYLGTLGAPHMDYILADHEVIPPENEEFFDERIVYLPNCFQVNDRQRVVADLRSTKFDFGLPNEGFIFCCFNNSYKVNPEVFSSWCRILGRVDGSVLWLYERHDGLADNLRKEARIRGIESERLIFGGALPGPEYLARYRLADLFLDTFPYNAGTTASDALMVGLPVLTRSGKSFPSRMAGSILKALNVPELVTYNVMDYENLAVELATNRSRLESIREKILANRNSTPLFDTLKTTSHIERAYKEMYKRYLEGKAPENIDLAS